SAQLVSDRIGTVDDPMVQHLAPRLFASIDRAIELCANTLKFGRAEEAPPRRVRIALAVFADEVAEAAWAENKLIRWKNEVPPDLEIEADPDHLFRILLNLMRNAAQALAESETGGDIRVAAHRADDHVHIDVADTGPGLPEKARTHLFEPFAGGVRAGGAGLGLAIVDELVRAHGGHVDLVESGPAGTHFRICVPDTGGSLTACDEAERLAAGSISRE
ncbi:sensor histidine kinase, partial [Parvibaculum sp.]|uniref:sensor histidine kinase n=1 Tax=Parvibaculum sp. TaxID=2024848 RepID=UPI0034A06201